MMTFTKEEIEKSINNLTNRRRAVKELWLETYDQPSRNGYMERYKEIELTLNELNVMLQNLEAQCSTSHHGTN